MSPTPCRRPGLQPHRQWEEDLQVSGHQTLRGVDHDPTLWSSATLQQHSEVAVLHHGCNTHPNLHYTLNIGAIHYNLVLEIQL